MRQELPDTDLLAILQGTQPAVAPDENITENNVPTVIRMSESAMRDMQDICAIAEKLAGYQTEWRCELLGSRADKTYAVHDFLIPQGTIAEEGFFFVDGKVRRAASEELLQINKDQGTDYYLIGQLHSHGGGTPYHSPTDDTGFEQLMNKLKFETEHVVWAALPVIETQPTNAWSNDRFQIKGTNHTDGMIDCALPTNSELEKLVLTELGLSSDNIRAIIKKILENNTPEETPPAQTTTLEESLVQALKEQFIPCARTHALAKTLVEPLRIRAYQPQKVGFGYSIVINDAGTTPYAEIAIITTTPITAPGKEILTKNKHLAIELVKGIPRPHDKGDLEAYVKERTIFRKKNYYQDPASYLEVHAGYFRDSKGTSHSLTLRTLREYVKQLEKDPKRDTYVFPFSTARDGSRKLSFSELEAIANEIPTTKNIISPVTSKKSTYLGTIRLGKEEIPLHTQDLKRAITAIHYNLGPKTEFQFIRYGKTYNWTVKNLEALQKRLQPRTTTSITPTANPSLWIPDEVPLLHEYEQGESNNIPRSAHYAKTGKQTVQKQVLYFGSPVQKTITPELYDLRQMFAHHIIAYLSSIVLPAVKYSGYIGTVVEHLTQTLTLDEALHVAGTPVPDDPEMTKSVYLSDNAAYCLETLLNNIKTSITDKTIEFMTQFCINPNAAIEAIIKTTPTNTAGAQPNTDSIATLVQETGNEIHTLDCAQADIPTTVPHPANTTANDNYKSRYAFLTEDISAICVEERRAIANETAQYFCASNRNNILNDRLFIEEFFKFATAYVAGIDFAFSSPQADSNHTVYTKYVRSLLAKIALEKHSLRDAITVLGKPVKDAPSDKIYCFSLQNEFLDSLGEQLYSQEFTPAELQYTYAFCIDANTTIERGLAPMIEAPTNPIVDSNQPLTGASQ